MALRDILVHIDAEDSEAGAHRRDYALSLAATFESHLTGFVLALQPTMPPMVMGEVPGTLLESQRKSAIEAANRAADEFVAAASRAGVSYERRVVECAEAAASSVFASHARITDLVVAGQSGPDDYLALHELLVEAALFDSGRPVLIVPYAGLGGAKLDHVLVTWNGGREAARAMHDALPLLGKAGNVEIVVVGDWVSALEPHEPGADVGHHLARHGFDVSVKRIAATGRGVSDTILSYASDVGADLVVMGGYGHSRLRQMVMGGVTRGMLQSMTVPVLMSH
jgi:nucleotide-binding universal stress UspA family protein